MIVGRALSLVSVFTFSLFSASSLVLAQAPTGTIAGVVTDPTGAPIVEVRIGVINRDSGLTRTLITSSDGNYSAAALPPGAYQLTAQATGFSPLARIAIVEAGTTTTVDLKLQIGAVKEMVTVRDATPLLRSDHHQVTGLISRQQIENLPLNGRNFLELAKLEPGVTTPVRTTGNRTFVPVLGSPAALNGSHTRVTVDGGSIMAVFVSGSAMGFSQDVVREFQLTFANFELSTGQTASGAINIVTRSGGNEFHGEGFYLYRDHNLAAYPALNRDPTNPDPFFQRRQFGFNMGGPLRTNSLFFFSNWEHNDQRGVASTQPRTPEFVNFGQIASSPSRGTLFSARLDFQATQNSYFYLRHSHDGSRAFAPTGGPSALPSSWSKQQAWADQSVASLTSTLRPNLINELYFSYFFISISEKSGQTGDCPYGCIGLGGPEISVSGASFIIGRSFSAQNMGRRYHLADSITWQINAHRFRFGSEYEYTRGGPVMTMNEPVQMVLYNPADVRRYNSLPTTIPNLRIPLPSSFNTMEDILRLPVQSFSIGIGNPNSHRRNSGRTRTGHVWHLYLQDTWRLRPRLTLNYGLGWFYDPHPNRDLSKPSYLAPIFGVEGLRPPQADRNNFSPSLGLAWLVNQDGRTVIRGGGGIYYDTLSVNTLLDQERNSLGPRGTGRTNYQHTRIANPLPNLAGVPFGLPFNFTHPTLFTGSHLITILPALRADLLQRRGDPNNRDFSVRNIEVDKLGQVGARDLSTPYAVHLNLGMQREITPDLVLSADLVYRHFVHASVLPADYNHFFSARGPVIPVCIGTQIDDPQALCSAGSINVVDGFGRATFKGLLMRLEKRFSRRTQFLASYAYSSNVGTNRVNNDDWFEGYGPLDRDVPHILNLSAIVDLPFRLQLGFNSTYYSRSPFTAFVTGLDFNGDGTDGDALPGTRVNGFNRGLGKEDLRRAIDLFNQNFAGLRTPRNQPIPRLTLPTDYEFGDNYVTQDLRLSWTVMLREKYKAQLIGEVFNLFNIANLSGHSGNLANRATFGQPTRRVDQVFGSGGPRAFQFGARLSF
ncbi:MAG TPA: carboxypeptidase regulatory-like domain-containing protein [Pyrinomonadaceae bacterium]|nr:carboxypeptidase regulatory-like domain-containing protein [Pyrinomonadaceae bacterium]